MVLIASRRLLSQQPAVITIGHIVEPFASLALTFFAQGLALQSIIHLVRFPRPPFHFHRFVPNVLDTGVNAAPGSQNVGWTINQAGVAILAHLLPSIDKVIEPNIQVISIFLNSLVDGLSNKVSIGIQRLAQGLEWAIGLGMEFIGIQPINTMNGNDKLIEYQDYFGFNTYFSKPGQPVG